MIASVYRYICAAVILSAAIVFAAGAFAVIYGFITFGLAFMGIMMILPFSLSHPEPSPVTVKNMPETERAQGSDHRAGVLRSA
jgi:hypothetical protein